MPKYYLVRLHTTVPIHKSVYVTADDPDAAIRAARLTPANWVFSATPVEDETLAEAEELEERDE